MKTLVLVRHAKSSWKDAALDDIDRPLNKRGKREAPLMAMVFADRDIEIELVICSSAKRARRTAKAFCGELGYDWSAVQIDERIYAASAAEILSVIRAVDDGVDSVMIIGHNPGLVELVNDFSQLPIDNVPTTGVATMVFDTNRWKKIAKLKPVELDLDYPKKHRDRG